VAQGIQISLCTQCRIEKKSTLNVLPTQDKRTLSLYNGLDLLGDLTLAVFQGLSVEAATATVYAATVKIGQPLQ
jgi:hypothetical protein